MIYLDNCCTVSIIVPGGTERMCDERKSLEAGRGRGGAGGDKVEGRDDDFDTPLFLPRHGGGTLFALTSATLRGDSIHQKSAKEELV